MTPYVFDIDGCLADTLPLVLEAYRIAAERVSDAEVTEEHVKQHWSKWLPDLVGGQLNAERVRRLKTELYLEWLTNREVTPLPAAKLARELLDAGEDVRVMTAANPRVIRPVLRAVGLLGVGSLGGEVLPEDRPSVLTSFAPRGTYYDDDEPTCWRVHAESEWLAIPV